MLVPLPCVDIGFRHQPEDPMSLSFPMAPQTATSLAALLRAAASMLDPPTAPEAPPPAEPPQTSFAFPADPPSPPPRLVAAGCGAPRAPPGKRHHFDRRVGEIAASIGEGDPDTLFSTKELAWLLGMSPGWVTIGRMAKHAYGPGYC